MKGPSWTMRGTGWTLAAGMLVALLAWPAGVQAQNGLDFEDSFESYGEGSTIIGSQGWAADETYYTVVTGLLYSFVETTYPIPAASHFKVVQFDTEGASISNTFVQEEVTNVWIDMVCDVTPSEEPPVSITNQTDIQVAFFFNTNYELVVYHAVNVTDEWPPSTITNRFTTLTNAVASTDGWTRITVEMDYLTDRDPFFPDVIASRYFRVLLNGQSFSSPHAYSDTSAHTMPGTWFICADQGAASWNAYLSSVAISGTGMFDDFVVTTNGVAFGTGSYTIWTSVDPSGRDVGTIAPWGSIQVPEGGGTNFQITASNYWYLAQVWTGNMPNVTAVWTGQTNAYNYVDAGVSDSYELIGKFEPYRTSTGVPHWWLAQFGWTNNLEFHATNNPDLDPPPTDVEWGTSTDPTDSNSFLHVIDVGTDSGKNWLKWPAKYVDPDLPPYVIERSTNLPEKGWSEIGTKEREEGTNTWWDYLVPAGMPTLYRVVATNSL